MNPAEYARMLAFEDRYWWFVSRRELVLDLVGRYVTGDAPRIVDVGCGTGATAVALGKRGRVIGLDFSTFALQACAGRGLKDLVRGTATAIPLHEASVDAIVATDIVEHLDDDIAALREFRRVLKPGGVALVTVPAYQFLWSEHDEALMHRRRYRARQLASRAHEAGFQCVRLSYALSFLFPLSLGRMLGRLKVRPAGRPPEAQIRHVPGWLNTALIWFQRQETALSRLVTLPWGLSVVAVLRRPTE